MSTPAAPSAPVRGFIITTPRLTIRTAQPADVVPLHSFLTSPANYGATPDLTPEALLARIGTWAGETAAGESAFVIIFARPTAAAREQGTTRTMTTTGGADDIQPQQEGPVIGFGGFNSLPRTTCLASGERRSDGVAEEVKVRAGDVGISFAADHQRKVKGYAREAICAMTEFGFDTLGCGYMHMDTSADNEGFRALMRDMGIAEQQGSGVEVDDAVFKFAWNSLNYDWDRPMWEGVKEKLRRRAKWPL